MSSTTPNLDTVNYKSLGNALVAANVSHVSSPTSDYYSQSVELDLPVFYYEKFIQKMYQWAMTNLNKSVQ